MFKYDPPRGKFNTMAYRVDDDMEGTKLNGHLFFYQAQILKDAANSLAEK